VVPSGLPDLKDLYDATPGPKTHMLIATEGDVYHMSFSKQNFDVISVVSLAPKLGPLNLVGKGMVVSVHVSPRKTSYYITSLMENFVLRSQDAGASWQRIGEPQGLRLDPGNMTDTFRSPAFKFVRSVKDSSTVYLAGFNGLHKSVDDGDSWGWIATIGQVITSFSVECATADCASFAMSMCSYDEGCTRATVDKAKLLDPNLDAMESTTTVPSGQVPNVQYSLSALSPDFANDNLEFRAQVELSCVMYYHAAPECFFYEAFTRSTDNFETFDSVYLPFIEPWTNEVRPGRERAVHAVSFSPAFAADQTMFVSGFNLGISKSTNGGRNFTMLWEVPGQTQLAISPTFPEDSTMACVLRPMDEPFEIAETAWVWWSIDGGISWTQVQGEGEADWVDLAVWKPAGSDVPVMLALKTVRYYNIRDDFSGNTVMITKDAATWVPLAMSDYTPYRHMGIALHALEMAPATTYGSSVEIFMGFARGGARKGFANGETSTLEDEVQALPTIDDHSHVSKSWAFDFYPAKNKANRCLGRKIQYSPAYADDGVIFGSSYFEVFASVDRGVTWRPIFSLVKDAAMICDDANCLSCSSEDMCIECAPGYVRTAFFRPGKEFPGWECQPAV